jgi:dihydrofolate synthase / folylpolyglutamate synthase
MSSLEVKAIETNLFNRGDDLARFILTQIPRADIGERMILAITSKIVSLAEDRLIPRKGIEKKALVQREADIFLGEAGFGCMLTVKEGLLIPSAGIDESNSASGDYILYPEKPFESARIIWETLREAWGLAEFGIIFTDSRTFPLRWGVTGVCLSYWGFKAVKSMIGTEDLFGRQLQMTKINRADALAAAAVLLMGEGKERRPLAILRGMECEFLAKCDPRELRIEPKDDLYWPLLRSISSAQ